MKLSRSARTILAVFMVLILLSACTPGNSKTGNETSAQAQSSGTAADSTIASIPADPFGKYEPAINLTAGRSTGNEYKFIDGEDFDNNIWISEYRDTLGINLKNSFVVDSTQYESKVNVIIASGDIPDIMLVNAKQAKMLMESDLIHEISNVVDQYGSELTKKMLTDDPMTLSVSRIEGKLMGIPFVQALDLQIPEIWIRSDWMKKLDLPEPKTANDVFKIAEAFVTQDPDGNERNDTIGISFDKGLVNGAPGFGEFTGWLNMFHAYKEIWLKDSSGNLVYSSIQPEMKAALQKLQDLYKAGIIDQEFGVKDGGKIAQDIIGEKLGIVIGAFWNPVWPMQDLKNKNPESDWTPYSLQPSDDMTVLAQIDSKIDNFFVISKKCKNPEALVKITNLMFENLFGGRAVEWSKTALSEKYIIYPTYKYALVYIEPPTLNRDVFHEVLEAAETDDTSKLTHENSKQDYDASKLFLDGDMKYWNNYKIRWDKNGGMGLCESIIKSGNLKYNEFFGVPGPVEVERSATMKKLENEIFTKIIMNVAPISEFDKYVEQWKSIGGNDLTKEINEWYAKNK